MSALGDGVDQDLDHRMRLCDLLGIDPEETTGVTIRIEAGTGAVVEWTGRRRVPLSRLVLALADVIDDPNPAPARPGGMSEWSIGADPFGNDQPRCDTCGDSGRVPWMVESDPNGYLSQDSNGTVPCPDCGTEPPC